MTSISSMDTILSKFSSVVLKQPVKDDDVVDRLHHFVTVAIFVFFALGTGAKEYFGHPISCWSPVHPSSQEKADHINTYCWTHQLRYSRIDSADTVNDGGLFEQSKPEALLPIDTAFFRWATFMFIFQAFLFKLPHFLWKTLNRSSGADLGKIRELVLQARAAEKDVDRKQKMDEVVAYFEDWITGGGSKQNHHHQCGHSASHSSRVLCLNKKSGNYLSTVYLSIKALYLLNVVFNFVLLTVFLDLSYWKYGLVVLNSVLHNGDWHDPHNFPRLLICDFVMEGTQMVDLSQPQAAKTERPAEPREYAVQCSMDNNLMLEKLFALQWFWLAFLFLVTLVSFVSWLLYVKSPLAVTFFTKSYTKVCSPPPTLSQGLAALAHGGFTASPHPPNVEATRQDFVKTYLKTDGVFVLRLLKQNSDKGLAADVVAHMWLRFCALEKYERTVAAGRVSESPDHAGSGHLGDRDGYIRMDKTGMHLTYENEYDADNSKWEAVDSCEKHLKDEKERKKEEAENVKVSPRRRKKGDQKDYEEIEMLNATEKTTDEEGEGIQDETPENVHHEQEKKEEPDSNI